MNSGLTLPNRQWDGYTAAELAALEDLAPQTLVWLLYGGAIDQLHKRQLAPYIDAHQPRLLYRPYADNIATLAPNVWATICYKRVLEVGHLGELLPANELNLEGMAEDWPRQIAWLKAFAKEWADTQMDDPCHLPALSPSGKYLEGYAAYEQAGLASRFAVVDFHVYAGQQVIDAVNVARRLNRPMTITEFNQLDPAKLFDLKLQTVELRGAVYFLLGGTADQAVHDLLKDPATYRSFKTWRPKVQNFDSPNHAGLRPQTLGCVVHATLGGTATPQAEFDATGNWFRSPASQVSAHAVIGPGHQIYLPVRPELEAWHCRASNATHRGLEMCKAKVGDAIAPEILDDAARVIAGWWLNDRALGIHWNLAWSTSNGLAEHREMPTNTDGHQDVGGPFDRADFLARVKAHAGVPEDGLTDQQKKAVLDDLNMLWGMTRADTIKANPAESERACHERIVAIKTALGLNG